MAQSRLIELSYFDPHTSIRLTTYADTIVTDYSSPNRIISAVRFGGYPEVVKAMSDAIYGGATIDVCSNGETLHLDTVPKGYRRQLSHDGIYAAATLMANDDPQSPDQLKEDAAEDDSTEENKPRKCYIFCPAGDQDRLFEEVDRKTAAPLIPEFRDYVLRELIRRGELRRMEVFSVKEKMDAWVLSLLPEDKNVVQVLEDGLKTGQIRYLNGCTLGKIKRELEEDGVPTAQGVERWSPSIIHNILTNEKYIGDALLQKTYVTDCINKKVKKNRGERTMYYVENSHPAIVSRDLFNQVQQEMTRRSSKRKVLQKSGKTELGKYSGKYALTELLVCGECGSPYKRVTWARNGEKRIVWRCVSRLEFGTKYCQHSPTLDEGRLHSAILAAMNEYAAIRQEVCPDVLAMAEEAKQALSQAGARLLQLKKRMDAVSREQSDVLDRLLVNMADTELNARMKALTDEKESLKAQIADAQQAEVNLEEQAARRRQMWDSIMECAAGYTEFDNELVRQVIQKITVEDAETIHIHFRDSDVVLEQEVE